MALKVEGFSLQTDGLDTPCRLRMVRSGSEIVRFSEGLRGPAQFSEAYQLTSLWFQRVGISVPKDADGSEALTSNAGRSVALSDNAFGEAFYCYYFPQMAKHHPENYMWEKL